jgi:hypothetical protein
MIGIEEKDMIINRIPAKTWNHLHMNQSKVGEVVINRTGELNASVNDVSLIDDGKLNNGELDNIIGGCGQEITEAAKKSQTEPGYTVQKGGLTLNTPIVIYSWDTVVDALIEQKIVTEKDGVYYITDKKNAGFVRLDFNYGKSNADINVVGIETKENASIDVYMDFNGDKDGEGFAAVQTRLYAAKDSVIRLIQIQRVGSETTFINDIGGYCEDGARIELVQLYLSGKNRYEGCEIKLAGDGSSMSAEIGYVAAGKERLDMNYCVRHIGKKTECAINAAGALRDTAFKLFRGTIDFIKGSAGSVGNEKEEVLLIDEKCVNQTIPIILCAEEDVVGNHGATIGKPDEELLFYLESRGIPAQECYNMLAAAKLLAVCGKIPDDGIRNEIHDYIKEVY